jgi:isopenicillin N synthase-like dioxygenase
MTSSVNTNNRFQTIQIDKNRSVMMGRVGGSEQFVLNTQIGNIAKSIIFHSKAELLKYLNLKEIPNLSPQSKQYSLRVKNPLFAANANKGFQTRQIDENRYVTKSLVDGKENFALSTRFGNIFAFRNFDSYDELDRYVKSQENLNLSRQSKDPHFADALRHYADALRTELEPAVKNKIVKVPDAIIKLESDLAAKRTQYLDSLVPFSDHVYNVARRVFKLIASQFTNVGTFFRERCLAALDKSHDRVYDLAIRVLKLIVSQAVFGTLGGIFGTVFIPIPVVGTLLGIGIGLWLGQIIGYCLAKIGDSKKVKEDPVDACFKFLDEVAIPVQKAYENACKELISSSDENQKKDIVSRFSEMLAENGYNLELEREIFKLKNGSPYFGSPHFEALSSEQKNTLENIEAIRNLFPIKIKVQQNAAAVKPAKKPALTSDKISQMKEALEKSNKVSDFAMRVLKLIASQVVCGTVGGLFGTVFIPIPVVGTLLGIGIGLWIGQIIGHCLDGIADSKGEHSSKQDVSQKQETEQNIPGIQTSLPLQNEKKEEQFSTETKNFLKEFGFRIQVAFSDSKVESSLSSDSNAGSPFAHCDFVAMMMREDSSDLTSLLPKIFRIKEGSENYNALDEHSQKVLKKFQAIFDEKLYNALLSKNIPKQKTIIDFSGAPPVTASEKSQKPKETKGVKPNLPTKVSTFLNRFRLQIDAFTLLIPRCKTTGEVEIPSSKTGEVEISRSKTGEVEIPRSPKAELEGVFSNFFEMLKNNRCSLKLIDQISEIKEESPDFKALNERQRDTLQKFKNIRNDYSKVTNPVKKLFQYGWIGF